MVRRRRSSAEPEFQGVRQPSRSAETRRATGRGEGLSPFHSAMTGERRRLRAEGRPIRSSPQGFGAFKCLRRTSILTGGRGNASCMSAPMSASAGIGERRGLPFSVIDQSNDAIRNLRQNRLADQTRQVAVVDADGEVLDERVHSQLR